jgi:hypothetical protein
MVKRVEDPQKRMVKIFVPTHNRPQTASTPTLLNAAGVDFILVMKPSQVASYKHFRGKHCKIAITEESAGIAGAREACRDILNYGEWCLQMDDNITGLTAADPEFYRTHEKLDGGEKGNRPTRKNNDHLLNIPVTFTEFYTRIIEDSLREAEQQGSNVIGFGPLENPAFRYKKFNAVSFTQNKMVLFRKTNLLWDQSNGHDTMEEYALLAAQLLEYGRVLVNKWGHPISEHYQAGGLGPYAQRLPLKRLAVADIMTRFPGLFRSHKDGELVLRWRELDQIERWRSEMKSQNLNPNLRDF